MLSIIIYDLNFILHTYSVKRIFEKKKKLCELWLNFLCNNFFIIFERVQIYFGKILKSIVPMTKPLNFSKPFIFFVDEFHFKLFINYSTKF